MNRTACCALVVTICGYLCSATKLSSQADPALALRTKTGESSFHVGERIPLELSFSSSSVKRYEISLARYDRSGRMRSEQFEVSPRTGWADPLKVYFANGYMGGGLSSSAALSSGPEVIELNPNEWVRFDEPGDYDVRVTSSRVSDSGKQEAVEVQSNALTVHIHPASPTWQELRLNTALATLHAVPATHGMTPEARTGAIADIRFLRSKAAIRAMAAGLRDDRQDELYAHAFGLIGLPMSLRDEALRAMQEQIDNPEFPISSWFLNAETQLLNTAQNAPDRQEMDRLRDMAWRKGFASLPRRSGTALANTADTLLNQPPSGLSNQESVQLSFSLSRTFPDLSPERQTATLLAHWDLLRSDAIAPALRKLAQLPLADPANNLSTIYATRELKAAALLRWDDLNPDEATRAAEQQVGSASPSLTERDLVFLKDRKMPQFEAIWANALLSETSYTKETALAGLLARFGTGTALPAVVEKLSKNVRHWACAPQGAALAYLVEFSPEQATRFLERAVAARGKESTACNHSVFRTSQSTRLAKWSPAVLSKRSTTRILKSLWMP